MRKDNLIRLVFFGIVFMLFGCSEDLFDELKTNSQNGYTFKRVPLNELATNQKFNKAYKKVSQKSLSNEISYLSRTQIENEYGFTIVDEPANVLEYDSKTSYSLEIKTDSTQTDELKNLVIEVDSLNASKQFIITYKLDENSVNNLSENEPIVIEEIAFDPNLAVSSRLRSDCIEITTIYCTASGSASYCGGEDTQFGCYRRTVTKCTGGGGSGLSVYGSLGVLTSPVDSNHGGGGSSQETFPDTPCGRIQKGTNSDKYKQNFKSLNKQEKFVLPMETGFAQKKTNGLLGYSYLQAPNGASLTVPLNSLNFTHVHNNHIVTIDGDTYDGGVKILSPADVLGLITTCQNASVSANINPNEAFGIMISNEGIFAITLLEPLSLTELGQLNPKWKILNDEYYEQAGQIITNQNLDANGRKGALQKVLLKFLKNAGLENKVGLFEGEVQNEIDSYNINWTKKSLNPTNPSAAPVETPC